MIVLGLTGGQSFQYEHFEDVGACHDASAVLIDDGRIVCAIEEERLNRIKHTNKCPAMASKFVLQDCDVDISDVDRIVLYGSEQIMNSEIQQKSILNGYPFVDIRTKLQNMIYKTFEYKFDVDKFIFIPHHIAHAMSTFLISGFDNSLIMTMDGAGDNLSGLVATGEGKEINVLQNISIPNSLGHFYLEVIKFLGYGLFDEYKVMGLAPYGDPSIYRKIFKKFYSLLPEGKYVIKKNHIAFLYSVLTPRKKKEPFTQQHKDIAAALQEALEEIVMHVLTYYQKLTKQKNICLAGGVAHNCTLTGKIRCSNMFENVYVTPSAHDAGCSIGAALYAYHKENPAAPKTTMDHVYLGRHVGEDQEILMELQKWESFIDYEYVNDITQKAADLISKGEVIGWVQGRSEFGPRALGNRSILADPRPSENKRIINAMVKKREGYRPFAPSILEEDVREYYDLPTDHVNYPFMNYIFYTCEEKRSILGAVTHVDGTARIQTVAKDCNPLYWDLINKFKKITGIPVLLNTSFNNNVEPIVDSAEDAIVCYLTTQLNSLVVGNYLISKKQFEDRVFLKMVPDLHVHNVLSQTKKYTSYESMECIYKIGNNYENNYAIKLSKDMYYLLSGIGGGKTVEKLIREMNINGQEQIGLLLAELQELWALRYVKLSPGQS